MTLKCAIPILAACFYFVGSNDGLPQLVSIETLNMNIESYIISNGVMASVFAISLAAVYVVKFDLAQISKSLLPQIQLEQSQA